MALSRKNTTVLHLDLEQCNENSGMDVKEKKMNKLQSNYNPDKQIIHPTRKAGRLNKVSREETIEGQLELEDSDEKQRRLPDVIGTDNLGKIDEAAPAAQRSNQPTRKQAGRGLHTQLSFPPRSSPQSEGEGHLGSVKNKVNSMKATFNQRLQKKISLDDSLWTQKGKPEYKANEEMGSIKYALRKSADSLLYFYDNKENKGDDEGYNSHSFSHNQSTQSLSSDNLAADSLATPQVTPRQKKMSDSNLKRPKSQCLDNTFFTSQRVSIWTANASPSSHLLVPTTKSIQHCFLGEDCLSHRNSPGIKCSACRATAHIGCIDSLCSRFPCRSTFLEDVRTYREQVAVPHHWVPRKTIKGKCNFCSTNFHARIGSQCSTSVGYTCSWCKMSYHSNGSCEVACQQDTVCDLGKFSPLIVPPSWIVKGCTSQSSSRSSIGISLERVNWSNDENSSPDSEFVTYCEGFIVKPIPLSTSTPLIVFVNPKSGGKQGDNVIQKLQWMLNPRQVFDLTQGGPNLGIDLYRSVPRARILVCGGDGTVGWVLSVLDTEHVDPKPPVGILPLGTGNDLARSLGWGGGYNGIEPLGSIVGDLHTAEVIDIDRWYIGVTGNTEIEANPKGNDKLPLNVFNNYFSLGVDAQIALDFHEAREANPEKFNSRFRNKLFYTRAGGKDLLYRSWRTLMDYVKVECDGVDITDKLKDLGVHSVVFCNIPSYGSGTHPWNSHFGAQNMNDGYIEVMGLTTYQLPLLQASSVLHFGQAGAHGHCIAQCRKATITTSKTIPMQVDGEAALLNPSTIDILHLNQAKMLVRKKKKSHKESSEIIPCPVTARIHWVTLENYARLKYDKDNLKQLAQYLGEIETETTASLEKVRAQLIQLLPRQRTSKEMNWCFLDLITMDRVFRVDRIVEVLYFIVDICVEDIYILVEEPLETGQVKETIPAPKDENLKYKETQAPDESCKDVDKFGMQHELLEKTSLELLTAARKGDVRHLTDLYMNGFSLLSIDRTGKTALHYAARFGSAGALEFLLTHANPAIMDIAESQAGQTALHKAARHGHRDICQALVEAGASLGLLDDEGRTATEMAREVGDEELANFLEAQEHLEKIEQQEFETLV